MKQEISEEQRKSAILIGAAIAFLLLALPLAVWLDLTELSKTALLRQALRLYQLVESRLEKGEKLFFEDEGKKERAEVMML